VRWGTAGRGAARAVRRDVDKMSGSYPEPIETNDTGDTTDNLFSGGRILRGLGIGRLKLRPQPPAGKRERAHASGAIEKGTGRATAIYWIGSSVTRAVSGSNGCNGRITFCDVVVSDGDD
jgi:hypothetical protein